MHGSLRRPARRTVSTVLVAAVVLAGAVSAAIGSSAEADPSTDAGTPDPTLSVSLAYEFLDARVDQFCDGEGRCLPRSYEGGFFTDLPTWDFTPSFV